jgi:hypothetical protein
MPKNLEFQAGAENIDIDKATQKALKILDKSINPHDFDDIYKDVDKDLAYVEEMEKRFREGANQNPVEFENISKMAVILEGIINEQIELSDWFGADASTIVPSRYDDIVNGVDCIVEFEEGENSASHLALAIDAVSSTGVRKKFERIKHDIDNGHLAEIKYFASAFLGIRGEKSNVPKVVIGADRKHIREVMELWLNNKRKELAEHYLQIQILKEIKIQLEVFIQYANSKGKPDMANIYKKALLIVKRIIREKNNASYDIDKIEEDSVYNAIIREVQDVFDDARHPEDDLPFN